MEDYKVRMQEEYRQLDERAAKLETILNEYFSGTLEFELSCPATLLEAQYSSMITYLSILRIRAKIEGVDLPVWNKNA